MPSPYAQQRDPALHPPNFVPGAVPRITCDCHVVKAGPWYRSGSAWYRSWHFSPHQPTQLQDGDRITIVGTAFLFRHPSGIRRTSAPELSDQTVIQVRTHPCWLLLADIVGSSELAQRVPPEQLALIIGSWLSDCRKNIEGCGGTINKYLGDGFFSYWRDVPGVGAEVLRTIRQMMAGPEASLEVRYVLHYGKVTMGGAPTMGEESLSGPDVNFLFRIEKVAGGLRLPFLCSDAVPPRLSGTAFQNSGRHPVPGFPGDYEMFTMPVAPGKAAG